MNLSECDQLVGRKRDICRGESGLPREKVNQYRRSWGFEPLPLSAEVVVIDSPQTRAAAQNQETSSPQPELPPLTTRVWNFAKAVTKHAANGFKRRKQSEIAKLVSICEGCPFFDKTHCTKCGCDCTGKNEFLNKLAWESEKCPDGRW